MADVGSVSWSPRYKDTIDYKIGIDPAGSDFDYTVTCSTTSAYPQLEHGDADPDTCEHEWWRYNGVTYTTDPPSYRYQCKLCGKEKFEFARHEPMPTWTKV